MCRLAVLAAVAALVACGSDTLEPANVDRDCTPLYEPTFDNVYANTLEPKCAVAVCHGASKQGGLDLADIDTAYAELTATDQGDRVLPGDPEHSELVMRIFTDVADFQMPPGDPLPASEQCAVARWVLAGAAR